MNRASKEELKERSRLLWDPKQTYETADLLILWFKSGTGANYRFCFRREKLIGRVEGVTHEMVGPKAAEAGRAFHVICRAKEWSSVRVSMEELQEAYDTLEKFFNTPESEGS